MISEAFRDTLGEYWLKIRSRHFWTWTQLVVTVVAAAVILFTRHMHMIGSISGASDYYTYLAATLIAFLGVSVSCYIFLIESIR
ncbi:MAG: hypothetical protein MJZ38_04695, partial [archaeon]|nr:hypothetical protein [archaeon]